MMPLDTHFTEKKSVGIYQMLQFAAQTLKIK
jgi:hypothetical protein